MGRNSRGEANPGVTRRFFHAILRNAFDPDFRGVVIEVAADFQ